MLNLLADIPWPIWLALAAGAVFAAYHYLGKNAALVAGGIAAILAVFKLGRSGAKDEIEHKTNEDSLDAIRRAEEARRKAREQASTPADVRKDDGFKRPADPAPPPPPVAPAAPPPPPAQTSVTPPKPTHKDDGFKRR